MYAINHTPYMFFENVFFYYLIIVTHYLALCEILPSANAPALVLSSGLQLLFLETFTLSHRFLQPLFNLIYKTIFFALYFQIKLEIVGINRYWDAATV